MALPAIEGEDLPQKSRVVAIVLAFFLGGFGAHRFYLRQPGIGIVYVLFSWLFIPAIIALVEMVIYLTQDDATWAAKRGFRPA